MASLLFEKISSFILAILNGVIIVAGILILIAFGLFVLLANTGPIVWFIWEWNFFNDKYEQRLFFTEKVEIEGHVIQKVNIIYSN